MNGLPATGRLDRRHSLLPGPLVDGPNCTRHQMAGSSPTAGSMLTRRRGDVQHSREGSGRREGRVVAAGVYDQAQSTGRARLQHERGELSWKSRRGRSHRHRPARLRAAEGPARADKRGRRLDIAVRRDQRRRRPAAGASEARAVTRRAAQAYPTTSPRSDQVDARYRAGAGRMD